jgi:hypothetical protein
VKNAVSYGKNKKFEKRIVRESSRSASKRPHGVSSSLKLPVNELSDFGAYFQRTLELAFTK